MIQSFADKDTEALWNDERSRKYSTIVRTALRKLIQLNAAESLNDLLIPPGNRLESLVGNRKDQHSIRINQQYRICFAWTKSGPKNVEIVDYHKLENTPSTRSISPLPSCIALVERRTDQFPIHTSPSLKLFPPFSRCT